MNHGEAQSAVKEAVRPGSATQTVLNVKQRALEDEGRGGDAAGVYLNTRHIIKSV